MNTLQLAPYLHDDCWAVIAIWHYIQHHVSQYHGSELKRHLLRRF